MISHTALVFVALFSTSEAVKVQQTANPIRKVVTLLQQMKDKVTADGEREQALYDKFMCWCKTSGGELGATIDGANNKIEALTSALKAATSKKEQTEADLKKHQTARADAKDAMAEATAVREKENAAFQKESADLTANSAATGKAIVAVERGMGGFLQTGAAQVVRNFAIEKATMPDSSRQELLAFLSGTQNQEYAPASGEIVGILKQMKDEMDGSLADAVAAEEAAVKSYNGLMAAKKKEVATLTQQIETELNRVGDLGVEIAGMENDLEDTQEALAADQQFAADTETACKTKTAEWEEISRTRQEELLALSETIKVLNDDDALELFKKTLPTPASSFMQVEVRASALRSEALSIIRGARRAGVPQPALDFISLAINGKKIGFDKVVTMIDEMVANLKAEQRDDDHKKEYCEKEFDLADDRKKGLENSISDSETAIEELKGGIAEATTEIAAINAGIAALDKSVAEATTQRKEENVDFKELVANNAAAREVLMFAKNRLNKFYNPKLHKAAPKRDLSEEERITVNMGGTLAPTTLGGIAGTGISFVQTAAQKGSAAPPPPPETFGAYSKKSGENTGVIAMIDLLAADLDKETTEAKSTEQNAQAAYQKTMQEATAKRAADSKSATEKAASKASMQESLESEQDAKSGSEKELAATLKFIHTLHGECDWLLKYYDVRSDARTGEIDSLGKAKDVLNGANFS